MATTKKKAKAPAGARLAPAGTLRATVDYAEALDAKIAARRFTWANTAIARPTFAVSGSGRHDLAFEVHTLEEDAGSWAVVDALAARGLRPATLFELVSTEAREGTTVALGSARVGTSRADVPCIADGALTLGWFEGAWPAGTRFLAIAADAPAGLGKIPHNHLLAAPKRKEPRGAFEPPCERVFEVKVDYAAGLPALMKAAKVKPPSADFACEVRGTGSKKVRVVTLHPNVELSREEALRLLASKGLRPAELAELLAAGAQDDSSWTTSDTIWSLAHDVVPGLFADGKRRVLAQHVGVHAELRFPSNTSYAGVAR